MAVDLPIASVYSIYKNFNKQLNPLRKKSLLIAIILLFVFTILLIIVVRIHFGLFLNKKKEIKVSAWDQININ